MDSTLIFVGVIVTLIVEVIKRFAGTERMATLAIVVVLSLIGGAASWYIQKAGLWDAFFQIAATSALVYSFVVKNAEVVVDDLTERFSLK